MLFLIYSLFRTAATLGNCALMRPCLPWSAHGGHAGLDADVLRGAQVIVEDAEAARRGGGDVVIAVEKGALAWEDLAAMAKVVRGDVALGPARRVVYKTVEMQWEDLAVATVVGVG